MLLLIIGLGSVEGHHGHGAQTGGRLVLPLDEGGVVELGPPAGQRSEGFSFKADGNTLPPADSRRRSGPLLADAGQFTAGHHDPF